MEKSECPVNERVKRILNMDFADYRFIISIISSGNTQLEKFEIQHAGECIEIYSRDELLFLALTSFEKVNIELLNLYAKYGSFSNIPIVRTSDFKNLIRDIKKNDSILASYSQDSLYNIVSNEFNKQLEKRETGVKRKLEV